MLDTRHASLAHSQNLPLTDGQNTAAPTLTEELHDLTVRRRTNEQETRAALAEVKKRKEGMERACGWFSSLKWRFLNTEVGVLVEVGKQVFAYKNGNRCSTPQFHLLVSVGQANHGQWSRRKSVLYLMCLMSC